jgi:hypothetical protein
VQSGLLFIEGNFMRWLVFLLLCTSTSSWAESLAGELLPGTCNEPEMIIVPDGHKASSAEMLKAQQQVESSVEATKVYLDCLLDAEDALGETITLEQKKDSIMRYNLAVARLEGLVDSFNQQLKAYKQVNRN